MDLTPSQTIGPFFAFGLCVERQNELVPPGTPGAVTLSGRLLDGAGEPVPDGMVELWQADESGGHREGFGWGRCGTDGDGGFRFVTARPGALTGEDGSPQAPHLTLLAFARGLLKPVLTRVYFPDEDANDADPVLAGIPDAADRETLIARAEDGELRFDIRLQGERQTVFFAT